MSVRIKPEGRKYLNIVLIIALMSALLTGCSANYVAVDKKLGTTDSKKPVVGVIVPGFIVNTPTNPLGAILGVKYGEEVTQCLKDQGVDAKVVNLSEVQTHQQLATAINKYNSLVSARQKVSEGFEFGDMKKDFNELGIDMLVIVSGSAGNSSTPGWVQAASFAAFGSMTRKTPSSDTTATSVTREGKPIYSDRTLFTRMGRRDFGDDGHRKAMAEAIAGGIRENSL